MFPSTMIKLSWKCTSGQLEGRWTGTKARLTLFLSHVNTDNNLQWNVQSYSRVSSNLDCINDKSWRRQHSHIKRRKENFLLERLRWISRVMDESHSLAKLFQNWLTLAELVRIQGAKLIDKYQDTWNFLAVSSGRATETEGEESKFERWFFAQSMLKYNVWSWNADHSLSCSEFPGQWRKTETRL